MSKAIQTSLLIGSLLLIPVSSVFAEANKTTVSNTGPASMIDISEAFHELNKAHFRVVTEIEQTSDGVYKVDALNEQGQIVEFVLDLKNPANTTIPAAPAADIKYLSASEIAERLTKEGYTVTKLKSEVGYYRVTALKDGKTERFHVNAVTAEAKRSWF